VLEINEGIGRPELSLQLVASDQLARPPNQQRKNLKRLLLQPDPQTIPVEFFCLKINLKGAKADDTRVAVSREHTAP